MLDNGPYEFENPPRKEVVPERNRRAIEDRASKAREVLRPYLEPGEGVRARDLPTALTDLMVDAIHLGDESGHPLDRSALEAIFVAAMRISAAEEASATRRAENGVHKP